MNNSIFNNNLQVFVEMLQTALLDEPQSDTVALDLLTPSDLQLLRQGHERGDS